MLDPRHLHVVGDGQDAVTPADGASLVDGPAPDAEPLYRFPRWHWATRAARSTS